MAGTRHTGSLKGCIVLWGSFAPRPRLVPKLDRGYVEKAALVKRIYEPPSHPTSLELFYFFTKQNKN
jgi:hypothetical protein